MVQVIFFLYLLRKLNNNCKIMVVYENIRRPYRKKNLSLSSNEFGEKREKTIKLKE